MSARTFIPWFNTLWTTTPIGILLLRTTEPSLIKKAFKMLINGYPRLPNISYHISRILELHLRLWWLPSKALGGASLQAFSASTLWCSLHPLLSGILLRLTAIIWLNLCIGVCQELGKHWLLAHCFFGDRLSFIELVLRLETMQVSITLLIYLLLISNHHLCIWILTDKIVPTFVPWCLIKYRVIHSLLLS